MADLGGKGGGSALAAQGTTECALDRMLSAKSKALAYARHALGMQA